MIEDMAIRRFAPKSQTSHIRVARDVNLGSEVPVHPGPVLGFALAA